MNNIIYKYVHRLLSETDLLTYELINQSGCISDEILPYIALSLPTHIMLAVASTLFEINPVGNPDIHAYTLA